MGLILLNELNPKQIPYSDFCLAKISQQLKYRLRHQHVSKSSSQSWLIYILKKKMLAHWYQTFDKILTNIITFDRLRCSSSVTFNPRIGSSNSNEPKSIVWNDWTSNLNVSTDDIEAFGINLWKKLIILEVSRKSVNS